MFDGTHLGGSFLRAAQGLGLKTTVFNTAEAFAGNFALRKALWHLGGRRPLHLEHFSARVVTVCAANHVDLLLATGAAPITASALRALRANGTISVNYSTDDPWNRQQFSPWYLRALPEYDRVFTTRRANIEDFRRLNGGRVHHLPFAYDEWLWRDEEPSAEVASHDVLFVGGADADRADFMREFIAGGGRVALVGAYWDRFSDLKPLFLGQKGVAEISALTRAAKINLCLVRRANRDGHVMRSFEIGALGACALVEDTAEHREIFGEDGECVRYFQSPRGAAEIAQWLILRPDERARLRGAIKERIRSGAHTYRDRLVSILAQVGIAPSVGALA